MSIVRAARPLMPTMLAMLVSLKAEGMCRDGEPKNVTGLEATLMRMSLVPS